MLTIGIIDDRPEIRESIEVRLELELGKISLDGTIIGIDPLREISDYPSWIGEHNITILIVDERLTEHSVGKEPVRYNGHELVKIVRLSYKELPVFVITHHFADSDIVNNAGDYDSVISKDDFDRLSSEYVKRFVRAAQKYYDNHLQELLRLSNLSEKIAIGTASDEEKDETISLQAKLEIPLTATNLIDREHVIADIEEIIGKLSQLSSEIDLYLREH